MYAPHYGRRQHGRRDPYFMLLMMQLLGQIQRLDWKPPVTLAVMAVNFLAFFKDLLPPDMRPWVPNIGNSCLQPRAILEYGQWPRLFISAFLHADEYHIYYNMSSFLWKGVHLERALGSQGFALLLLELLLLSHGLVVGLSALLPAYISEYGYLYYSTCAVGFSAVIFALKVVLNHQSPGHSEVFGIVLPTKYICWAELVIASLINPHASFFGHLCGILAGFIHVRYISRLGSPLSRLRRAVARALQSLAAPSRQPPGQGRYAAGTGGSASFSSAGSRLGGGPGGMPADQATGMAQARPAAAESAQQRAAAAASSNARVVGSGPHARRVSAPPEVVFDRLMSEEELRRRRLQRFQQQ